MQGTCQGHRTPLWRALSASALTRPGRSCVARSGSPAFAETTRSRPRETGRPPRAATRVWFGVQRLPHSDGRIEFAELTIRTRNIATEQQIAGAGGTSAASSTSVCERRSRASVPNGVAVSPIRGFDEAACRPDSARRARADGGPRRPAPARPWLREFQGSARYFPPSLSNLRARSSASITVPVGENEPPLFDADASETGRPRQRAVSAAGFSIAARARITLCLAVGEIEIGDRGHCECTTTDALANGSIFVARSWRSRHKRAPSTRSSEQRIRRARPEVKESSLALSRQGAREFGARCFEFRECRFVTPPGEHQRPHMLRAVFRW